MQLSELPNPYDPANPITDPNLFVGRAKEMNDIKYYLDHAKKVSHPINLAILGNRASGKTSTLNMIEIEAKKRGFLSTRIDLDEGDVETQLAFFYKIFDSILTTACSQGAFEGVHSKTYGVYRDMVDAYEVTEDKTFCPFVFPIQYAKAMSKANTNAPLSETNFIRDLKRIQGELKSPIIVLLDECDVLTKSRVHLEKLRNIFVTIPQVMLVMTGSPALFPLMNEVFSPIIRQFRKIYLEAFKEKEDTEDCIRSPLQKIDIARPSELFDFESYHDVREVHDLSGGRPYEIQLLCHIMFRRVQEERAKRMEITVDALDEVRKELESFQDVPSRAILTVVRSLDKRGLSALGLLCRCSGYATFEQVWFTEFVFSGEKRWTKETLLEQLNSLRENGVITTKDDIISFAGDDFDRIYAKYFSRKQGAFLSTIDFSFEVSLVMRLHSFLRNRLEGIQPFGPFGVVSAKDQRIREAAMMLKEEGGKKNPFETMPDEAQEVYKAMINFRETDDFQAARVTVISPWITVQQWYRWRCVEAAKGRSLSTMASLLSEAKKRALAADGDLDVEIYELPIVPVKILTEKIETSENAEVRRDLSSWHCFGMFEAYLKQHDVEEAIFHGELTYKHNPRPQNSNNFGYLLMVSGNLAKARELLEKAVSDYEQPIDQALPIYNLGVVEAKEGDLSKALEKFELTMDKIKTAEKRERMCACLILPKIAEEKLIFEEVIEPDLVETAQSAATAVSKFLNTE